MHWLSSFRARLILSVFPVVVGVTAGALLLAEWKFSDAYQQLFEEQFESQITAVAAAKHKRFAALSSVLDEIAINPRLLAAMADGDFPRASQELRPALESLAQERLQTEFASPGKASGGRTTASLRLMDDRSRVRESRLTLAQATPYIALIDRQGALIPVQRSKQAGAMNSLPPLVEEVRRRSTQLPWLGQRNFEQTLKDQQVGYLVVETGERRTEQVREVFITPLRDPTRNQFLGGFLFGLPMPALADRVLYEQTKRSDNGEIMGGMFVEGRLVTNTIPPAHQASVASALTASLERSTHNHREIVIPINGINHRLIYRVLNPESPFPRAVQVNLYSLAALDAEIRDLRRNAFGLGAIASLVALGLILWVSRSLSGPIKTLVAATHRIEQGDFEVRVPVTPNEVGRLSAAFNDMAAGLALQEKYRSVLHAIADRSVAERLLEDRAALGGELREVTILFCDIRGFASLSEKMEPADVIEMLNEHMTAMTEVAYAHGGIVDKFVGDLIMVLFGVPVSQGEDAKRAVECARAMLHVRWELNGISRHPLEVGIGIATGQVVAGCMGSNQRLSYTVLGPRVNLASRLCSVAQPGEIVLDDATVGVIDGHVPTRPLQPMQLKGFSELISCYAVGAA